MFSRLMLLAVMVLSLAACDRFLKGQKEDAPSEVIKIEFKDGECLKSIPTQLQNFLNDQDGLGSSVPCVQTALRSFMRLTRGDQADSYKAKELQDFFNLYLLKENKISNDFLDDIMKLKVVVVGGDTDIATRVELERFSEFLGDFAKEIERLKGHIRLLTFKEDRSQVTAEGLADQQVNLKRLVDFVLKNSRLLASRYQWSDFLAFLAHLHQFVGESKELEELLGWVPLIDSAKIMFLGDSAKLLSQKDWTDTKDWLIQGFFTVLKFHYQVKHQGFSEPSDWTRLVAWIDEVLLAFETAPVMKDKKLFDAAAIDKVIIEVYRKKLVTTKLSSELIQQTYRKALAYFVEASSIGADPLKIKGLSEDHLKIIKAEYNIWKASQVFVNRSYGEDGTQNLGSLRARFKKIDSKGFPFVSALERPEYNQAWQDFYQLLSSDQALVSTEKLKLQIDYQSSQTIVPFSSMNLLNGIRTLSRFALRGYGTKDGKSLFQRRISKQRMIDLEENFREFGRAIGFFDPDKTTAGKETFEQANLLVFHSNGDASLDAIEMTEILSFLISGGKTMLDEIYKDLETRGCLLPDLDAFQRHWVNEVCFVRALREQTNIYMDHLPEGARFFNGLTNAQFLEAYRYLLKVATGPRHRPGQLESGEIRTLSTVLHFVEAVVMMYDKDQSSLLTQAEVSSAFPRFHDVIEEQALKENVLAGLFLEDIFLFLVYEGKKPSGTMDVLSTAKKKYTDSLGEVDKLKILKLLSVMKDLLANAPKK